MTDQPAELSLEDAHRVAVARELTAAAGVPLRDRYGFACPDEEVMAVVNIVFRHPDDQAAVAAIDFAAFAEGEIELAEDYDTPAEPEYLLRVVAALRPLCENRRAAAARGLS